MIGPYPLPGGGFPASINLDGTGAGQVGAGPTRVREHWQVTGAGVSVNTTGIANPLQSMASAYKGPVPNSATFIGTTPAGNGGTLALAGIDIQPGEQIWIVWENGPPNAQATMVVYGTYTIGSAK